MMKPGHLEQVFVWSHPGIAHCLGWSECPSAPAKELFPNESCKLKVKLIDAATLTVLSLPDDSSLCCGYVATNWLPTHPNLASYASSLVSKVPSVRLSETHLIPGAGNHPHLLDVGFEIKYIILQITQISLCMSSVLRASNILVRL